MLYRFDVHDDRALVPAAAAPSGLAVGAPHALAAEEVLQTLRT
ncbi:hypothetical protein [Thiocystis violascens]|nr:hypothetical protein [Thiocystis violascens]